MTAVDDGALAFSTIPEIRRLLDRREVSVIELAEFFVDRLRKDGGRFNAVAAVTQDRARREARRADEQLARGDEGALVGIPYGVKDIFETLGAPTRDGSRASLVHRDNADANVVRRLTARGSVLVGKLALVELVGLITRRPWASENGPARSPWDLSRWAGGSSGGSGAAVSAGLVPFALGSETAGSIASPAAWCGVTGFRPTFGAIGRGGMTPVSPSLDKPGVLAHSAEDCAIVLDALVGADGRDRASRRRRFSLPDVTRLAGEGWSGRRVGVDTADLTEIAPPPTQAALAAALRTIDDAGARRVTARLPQAFPYRETIESIMLAEATVAFATIVATNQLHLVSDPAVRRALRSRITAKTYLLALEARDRLVRAISDVFDSCDVLVSYNFVFPWPYPSVETEFGEVPIRGGNTALAWAGNLAGLPAVFLPVGLTAERWPVGIQVVGPPGSDELVLALGMAFQRETPWHRARPTHAS